jgi:outer membrane protein assembly factor BamB
MRRCCPPRVPPEAWRTVSGADGDTLELLRDRAREAYRQYRERGGSLEVAYNAVEDLLAELEQQRLQDPHAAPDVSLGGEEDPCELAAVLAYAQGKNREAFEHLERARARDLLDRTLNRVPIAAAHAVEPGLLLEEVEASRRVMELTRVWQDSLRERDRAADRALERSLSEARARLLDVRAEIRRQDAAYAAVRGVTPAALADVQALLDPHTALLAYGPTCERLLIFIVESGGFWAEHVDIAKADLIALTDRFRDVMARFAAQPRDIVLDGGPGADASLVVETDQRELADASRALYQVLITPALPHLRGVDRLCIVPHDDLRLIPFQALLGDQGYLIERFTLSYGPSISLLDLCYQRQRQSQGRLLALGNPDLGDPQRTLPFAESEALAISTLMDARALVRNQATRSAMQAALDQVDMLHFACHAEWNAQQPEFSALLLTPDSGDTGRLEVQELFRLERELSLSLVTLSACQTSLAGTKGLAGLAAGFLYAGAAAVVASLWSVADFSTSELMIAFYRNLADMDRGSALRAAQLAMLRSSEYRHPYHWAGFVLIGSQLGINSEQRSPASAFNFVHLWTFRSTAGLLKSPCADPSTIYAICLPERSSRDQPSAQLMAISLRDRCLLWQRDLDRSGRLRCPVPGLVHVSTPAKVSALRRDDGAEVWSHATDTPFTSKLAFAGELLYSGGRGRLVHAMHAITGAVVWSHELPRPGSGGFLCGLGRVFVGCADHHVYALDAGTGALRWERDLGFTTWHSGPAWITNGRLFTKIGTFELESGDWDSDLRINDVATRPEQLPVAVAGPLPPDAEGEFYRAYVRADADLTFVSASHQDRADTYLSLFDSNTGALLRRFHLGPERVRKIARVGDIVVVGDGDGRLHGFSIGRVAKNHEVRS